MWWEGRISAAAYVDRARLRRLRPVAYIADGSSSDAVEPSGRKADPPLSDAEEDALRENLEAAVEEAGGTIEEIALLRPWGTAAAVTVRVPKPAAFLARRSYRLRGRIAALTARFPEGRG